MTSPILLPALFIVAVLLGWARVLFWQSHVAPEMRSRGWRVAALLALQAGCAALLYLTLMPPALPGEAGTLVVATHNTSRTAALATGERLIALPEAGAMPGAARAPDLATALRREPSARLHILGDGLEPRDREAAQGVAIEFDSLATPRGIVRVSPPGRTAPGSAFAVGGETSGGVGGTVELLDPAGRRVDAAPSGRFKLEGTARLPGQALFKLRLLDGRKVIEEADLPVWTAAEPPLRVLIVAGAPDPEIKYLRRWAADAGVQLQTQVSTGGGIALGDTPLPLGASTLRRFDVAVLDDRSWAALGGGERAAIVGAVRDGMGLLLRVTGPLGDGVRRQWQSLGIAVSAAPSTATTTLRAHADADALAARRGPGSAGRPSAINPASDDPALLTHRIAGVPRRDAAPLLPGVAASIANYHAEGRGRVGLWTLTDSYTLVLAGDADRHAELWSAAFAALARARSAPLPAVVGTAWQGGRVALCNLAGPSEVIAPGGERTALLPDPAAGVCAGFWPAKSGWHIVRRTGAAPDAPALPVFIHPAESLAHVRASDTREATLRLAQASAQPARGEVRAAPRRGSSWPWFAAWLVASAALWWFERSRLGRHTAVRQDVS